MLAYLSMMALRLLQLRRLSAPTGRSSIACGRKPQVCERPLPKPRRGDRSPPLDKAYPCAPTRWLHAENAEIPQTLGSVDLEAAADYAETLRSGHDRLAKSLKALHAFLGPSASRLPLHDGPPPPPTPPPFSPNGATVNSLRPWPALSPSELDPFWASLSTSMPVPILRYLVCWQ